MSRKEIEELAGGKYSKEDINTVIEDDLDLFGKKESYMYQRLQQAHLSPDAQEVLDAAKYLVKYSFHYRDQFTRLFPESQLNTWDAGWYQIDALLGGLDQNCQKKGRKSGGLDPEKLKQFDKLYKQFSDRMRPLVYELGFLYK